MKRSKGRRRTSHHRQATFGCWRKTRRSTAPRSATSRRPTKTRLAIGRNPEDWVSWDVEVVKGGKYEVEIQQGCAGGGSEVAIEIAGQTIRFVVQDTGHFQNFILRTIGVVDLPVGHQTLAVKPQDKKGGAVMDLRRVVLRTAVE